MTHDESPVFLDNSLATVDANGIYSAPGWDSLGIHSVFCGGVSQSYEIRLGQEQWEIFEAFRFSARARRDKLESSVVVCGPIVYSTATVAQPFLSPLANCCLIGAVPGEIEVVDQNLAERRGPECLFVADFPVVWALPPNPHRCDKSQSAIRLVEAMKVKRLAEGGRGSQVGRKHNRLRWCNVILDAARKGLHVEPGNESAHELWALYCREARRLWRRMR
jgi:hypothetical protein